MTMDDVRNLLLSQLSQCSIQEAKLVLPFPVLNHLWIAYSEEENLQFLYAGYVSGGLENRIIIVSWIPFQYLFELEPFKGFFS